MDHYIEIDVLKGIAVISMIIFHIPYLIHHMNIRNLNGLLKTVPFKFFAKLAQVIFITMVGVNMAVSSKRYDDREKYKKKQYKRALKVAAGAIAINILSYAAFPKLFVKFGILHFVAVAILIQTLIVESNIAQMILIALSVFFNNFKMSKLNVHDAVPFVLGFYNTKYSSMDHFPIFPWIALVCVGAIIGNTYDFAENTRLDPEDKAVDALSYIGKNSFNVYMLHWPILYFILRLIR